MSVSPEQMERIFKKIDFQAEDRAGRGVLLLGKIDQEHYDTQIDLGSPYFLEKFGLMLIHSYLLNQGVDKADLNEITEAILNRYQIPTSHAQN